MKIYLIRHGETTGDIEDRYGGDYEDHLTQRGIQQSKECAEKLKGKDIEIIYHSPRIRATETARILGEVLGVKLQVIEDFRERNSYGVMTGMVKAEAEEKYPEEVAKFKKDKVHHNVKESENYESLCKRVFKALNEIPEHKVIALVTHGGPISTIFREIFGKEFEKLGDCAILELEKNGDLKLIRIDGAVLKS